MATETFTVRMKFQNPTKNKLRYFECDEKGEPKEWGVKIGDLYIPKDVTRGVEEPFIEVTVSFPNSAKPVRAKKEAVA